MSDVLDGLKDKARELIGEAAKSMNLDDLKRMLTKFEGGGADDRLVDADVTSAVPLIDAEREKIDTRLKARYGDDLAIHYKVDAGILGGLIVRVGDRYIDDSVASRLSQLRETLTGAQTGS